MNIYRIELTGQVAVSELNAMSPHQMTVIRESSDATTFTICTDQSGMIGMLRHLHNLGLTVMSVVSAPAAEKPDLSIEPQRKQK